MEPQMTTENAENGRDQCERGRDSSFEPDHHSMSTEHDDRRSSTNNGGITADLLHDSSNPDTGKVDDDDELAHSVPTVKATDRRSGSPTSRKRRRSSSSKSSRSKGSRSRINSRSQSKTRSRSKSPEKKREVSKRKHSSGHQKRKDSKSVSPTRRRSSSSTSCDTYGSFKASSPVRVPRDYPCKKCDQDFETIRELCEHEIAAHGASFPCPHCEKQSSSVQKLCEHMKRRHDGQRLICDFCKEDFGGRMGSAKDEAWEEFRAHVYKECLKEKIYQSDRHRGRSGTVAQRGRGRCPHGPPVKCKNFPNCPGEKCYYFHGICRYDKYCVKKECPFDHSERPRTCLSCLRDYRRRF